MTGTGSETFRITRRPGPYEPAVELVTYATPSCCCCCCCLATTAAAVTFGAADSFFTAESSAQRRASATGHPPADGAAAAVGATIGGLAPIAAVASLLIGVSKIEFAPLLGGGIMFFLLATAYLIAGAGPGTALLRSFIVSASATALFAIEIFAVLGTVFLIELAAPLAAWGAYALARSMHRTHQRPVDRVPFPSWPQEGGRPLPPPGSASPGSWPDPDAAPIHPPWRPPPDGDPN